MSSNLKPRQFVQSYKPMLTNKIRVFGEVLLDEFPDGQQILGGAPFNVAWHLQAFGQATDFISRIGDDTEGLSIKQAMQHWGMNLENIQVDPIYPTGKVQITLHNGEPHYAILANQAYDFIDASAIKGQSMASDVLYHGTLALRQPVSSESFAKLIANHAGKIFLDVNLRQPWWQTNHVETLLNRANWAKLNEDELQCLQPTNETLNDAMRAFRAKHKLDVLIVTRGEHGAIALDSQANFYEVVPGEAVRVVDTVGAGDAFSAAVIVGLQREWPLPLTLQRAQAFASALVGQQGAIIRNVEFYQAYRTAWQLG